MLALSETLKRNLIIGITVILLVVAAKVIFFSKKVEIIKTKQAHIINRIGDSAWEKISSVVISDIVAMNFDDSGQYGAAISLEGSLIKSVDGGENWNSAGAIPLIAGELVNAIGVSSDGRVVVGTSVDDSSYTGIYRETTDGKWQRTTCQDCGGILAISNDGEIAVGGGGLISTFDNQLNKSEFNYLPDWAAVSLYGISSSENNNKLWVTGENALVGVSQDHGKSWQNISPSVKSTLPFYSIASSKTGDKLLVGGVNGRLLLNNEPNNSGQNNNQNNRESNIESNNNWIEVKGLSKEMMISSLLLTDKVLLAGGGKLSGVDGFIVSSVINNSNSANSFDGEIWQYDRLPKGITSIVAIKISARGLFAASSDGNILRRVKNNF